MSVLLVEDDESIAIVITAALEAEGFAVTRCDSIAERDRIMARERFSALVTDVKLPDGDGIENLLEYAFQLDPTASSTHELPRAALVGENLEMTFTPPSAVTGILWAAEWSSSLAQNDWHSIPNTGIAPLHTYQISARDKDRAFIRIRVSEP